MRGSVGPLGWTPEELTKRWYGRDAEAPDSPRWPNGPPLGETLLYLYTLAQRSKPGARGNIAKDIALVRRLLRETGGNAEHARTRFILERANTRLAVEPPRARLTVRSTRKDLIFEQTGKLVIDLTPEKRSVFSKRFTRAMKTIRPTNRHRS